ncbi:hypothetical protein JG068_045 [Burkholderia phage JG068]|uniref:Uncharacterized protein n=1 Tax=Burkholderia phage JG068 TaxID=1401297 RepID=U3PBC3_9CAUD|nr:hypothetical protein JG068_045 [Burkholderia phage JG068]AGW43627.1 hypothetical protein JG068_045 [Burkholderia phage JG068]
MNVADLRSPGAIFRAPELRKFAAIVISRAEILNQPETSKELLEFFVTCARHVKALIPVETTKAAKAKE